MKTRLFTFAVLFVLAALLVLLAPGAIPLAHAASASVTGPTLGTPVTPSSFDGDVRAIPAHAAPSRRVIPDHHATTGAGAPPGVDTAVQSEAAQDKMPTPLKSFDGLDFNSWGSGWPPDTNGDVGPTYYIQAVNTSFGIFAKSTGTRVAALTFDTFWSKATPQTGTMCDSNNEGDPVVLYDTLSDRWLITDFAFDYYGNVPGNYECIAVSKSGNPVTGGWWFYAIPTDAVQFPDYPKFGLWPDAYYMMTNMFNANNSFGGVRVWALDRATMTSGGTVTPVYFQTDSSYAGIMPANLRGAQPPTGSPEYFASIDSPSTNQLHIWKFHYDSTTPLNSWFGKSASDKSPYTLAVTSFVEPCYAANLTACVPSKNGENVDALGDRLMVQLEYRNISGTESLWATHTVANAETQGSVTGIRWYQVNVTGGATPTVRQQSTFKPADGIFRWLPSLAVDKFGNMAVGYNAANANLYPSIRYAGRLSSDPLNQLAQGETTLIAGAGSQSGGYNRWGDYSGMTVDPTDDCTFWYTNEYFKTTSDNWQTRIGSFRYPQCTLGNGTTTDDYIQRIRYDEWIGVADAGASGGWYRASSATGNTAVFPFSGTAIKWVYPTGLDQGIAQVFVDGVNKGTVDQYTSSPMDQRSKTYSGLANRSHTLTIKVLGTHNPSSTGNKVAVDAFVAGTVTRQESANIIRWNNWVVTNASSALGGAYHSNTSVNARAAFQFTGSAIRWITVKGPTFGKAEVYIDGVDKGSVDLYAASPRYFQVLSFPVTPGTHYIVIKVLHTKNAASTGYQVAVDGFNVLP